MMDDDVATLVPAEDSEGLTALSIGFVVPLLQRAVAFEVVSGFGVRGEGQWDDIPVRER